MHYKYKVSFNCLPENKSIFGMGRRQKLHTSNCPLTSSRPTLHGLLILFLRLGLETRIPPVPKDCFGIVQVGNDIFKKIYRANFDFL